MLVLAESPGDQLEECRIECPCEQVMCIITAEHCQCFRHCLHFQLARLLTLFPFFVGHGTFFLQHHEELFICRQRLFGVLNIFFCLCIFLVCVSELSCFLLNL